VDAEHAKKLREPFPPEAIGKLPKGGTQLDYVGHAAVTDRLLQVDPEWHWAPIAYADDGGPLIRMGDKDAELWITLTVCEVTRIGVGSAPVGSFELAKQLVSDALRNAAMRFGVALDLWSKEDLTPTITAEQVERVRAACNTDELRQAWLVRFGCKPAQLHELALVDNLQRADLTALEEAHAIHDLITEYGYTQRQLGERESAVAVAEDSRRRVAAHHQVRIDRRRRQADKLQRRLGAG
jgi:hypothetical protein